MLGTNDRNEDDRPAFGATAVRLYRNDMLWRGAVDLISVGSLIMLLTGGFPDIFKGFGSFFSSSGLTAMPQSQNSGAALSTGLQQPAANFQSVPVTTKNNQPTPSVLPKPVKISSQAPKIWIGAVPPEDRETLEKAADLMGADNQKAISMLKEKAEAGEPNFQYLMGSIHVNEASVFRATSGFETAVYWYKEAAGMGHPAAQYQLGQIYRLGVAGIEKNYQEAVKWYEMAAANAENKTGEAENELGRLYEKGIAVPKDTEKALKYYELAAAKGEKHAKNNMAALYYNGGSVARDLGKAIPLVEAAAENGDTLAQLNLARIYFRGRAGGQPDYAQFLKWAGLAAEQGNVEAMMLLGDFYREGKPGFEIDQKMAAKYYRLAALKKDPKGQFLLAEMYEQGFGVPKDNIQAYVYYNLSYKNGGYPPAYSSLEALKAKMSPSELDYGQKMVSALTTDDSNTISVKKDTNDPVEWWRKAAEQGNDEAQLMLGNAYLGGQSVVKKDDKEAAKWLRKAADQKNVKAQIMMGKVYHEGIGVEKDDKEAAKWFRLAAEEGDAMAQYNLGLAYYQGVGVEKDYEEAVKWWRKAAVQGDANAQRLLDKYAK